MNKIFKIIKKGHNSVVVSELAKGAGKGRKLTAAAMAVLLSSFAHAAPVSIQGTATSENAVSVGTNSFATSVDGVANGQGSVATGQGFTRDEFAAKKQEAQAAIDAVNGKQAELNNLNNNQNANNNAIDSLNKQIDDLSKQQEAIRNKLAQRDNLTIQKDGLQSSLDQANQDLARIQNDLAGFQNSGKNIFVNFTDVLESLDWGKLQRVTNNEQVNATRNELATSLKEKINAASPEIATKYNDAQYRGIIDGYLNRKGAYQGSFEYLRNDMLGNNAITPSQLYNKLYYNTPLMSSNYQELNDDYSLGHFTSIHINNDEHPFRKYSFETKDSVVNSPYYVYSSSTSCKSKDGFGCTVVNGKVAQEYQFYKTEHYGYDSIYGTSSSLLNAINNENYLNTITLIQESAKKLRANGINYIGSDINYYWKLEAGLSLGDDFVKNYNMAQLNNSLHNPLAVQFLAKTNTGSYYSPFEKNDGNIGVLSKLKDLTVNNSNLISTEDITFFKKFYQKIQDQYNKTDWNDADSAINLTDYKASLDKVLAYNGKIDNALNIYQEIINERKKSDSDNAKIDNLTSQLLKLNSEILAGTSDMTNFLQGMKLTYTDKAREYLNYGKAEADAKIARINNELKLYNDKDQLIVDISNKAKELQKQYDDKKAEIDAKQKEIDGINKQINDLALTDTEKATDDVKRAKEAEKAAREADKARLEGEIQAGEEALAGLKARLSQTSLKDLGLRSQAYGSNAFASGNDSIAIGTQSTVTKADGIALGQNATVTGEKSIAIGKDSTVSGEKSIAIGVGHNVSGNHSSTIGDPNTITGNNVFVAGNNNNVASNNVMVMGNNVTVGTGFDNAVVLGANSAVAAANAVTSMDIGGKTYNFAGTAPNSVVSVGAADQERQIVNVAAGRVTETSTDAINGSQLYALAEAVKNNKVSPKDVSDEVTNQLEAKLVAGDNISIDKDDATNTFTIAGKNTQSVVKAGNGVAVAEADNAQGTKDYTVSVSVGDGLEIKDGKVTAKGTSITAGDNVEVTGDATNGYTIKATDTNTQSTSSVVENKGLAVTETDNSNGTKNYAFEAKIGDGLKFDNKGNIQVNGDLVKAGKNIEVSGNSKDGFTINAKPSTNVAAGEGISVSGDAENGYTITNTVKDTNTQSVVKAGNGVAVAESDNAQGTKDYTVSLSDNLVKAGNNIEVSGNAKDGFTINAKPATTINGGNGVTVEGDATNGYTIKAKGTEITAGDNITLTGDATNGYTIAATDTNTQSTSSVAKNKGLAVTATDNANGTKNYEFEAKVSDGLSFDSNGNIKVNDTLVKAGDNIEVSGNAKDGFTIKAKSSTIVNGGDGVEVTGNAESGYTIKAKGTQITAGDNISLKGDATNGYTISAKGTELTAGDNITLKGDATNGYTIAAKGTELTAGDNIALTGNAKDGYTVAAKNTQSVTKAGQGVTVDATDNAEGTKDYTVSIKTGAGLTLDNNGNITNDLKLNAGDNVKVSGNAKEGYTLSAVDTNTQATVSAAAKSGLVVKATDNANGTKNYAIEAKLGKGLTVDENGAIAATAQNVKGGNGVSVTPNENGEQVINVAGVTTTTDDGKSYTRSDLTKPVAVRGDGKNTRTTTNALGDVVVSLNDTIVVDTVKTNNLSVGNVKINQSGIHAGGRKVTGVANGNIAADSTDAVNGSQLHATNQVVNQVAQQTIQNTNQINNVNQRVSNVENRLEHQNRKLKAGIAGSNAAASLPQVRGNGKSMMSAAVGTYEGQNAVAVGYSRASDNGKVIFKVQANANSRGKVGGGVGVGYEW